MTEPSEAEQLTWARRRMVEMVELQKDMLDLLDRQRGMLRHAHQWSIIMWLSGCITGFVLRGLL